MPNFKRSEEHYYTVGDTARRVGVGVDRVRALERAGQLPAIRTASGIRLFRQIDVEKFAAERAARKAAR